MKEDVTLKFNNVIGMKKRGAVTRKNSETAIEGE
jgi:hypothetical protein